MRQTGKGPCCRSFPKSTHTQPSQGEKLLGCFFQSNYSGDKRFKQLYFFVKIHLKITTQNSEIERLPEKFSTKIHLKQVAMKTKFTIKKKHSKKLLSILTIILILPFTLFGQGGSYHWANVTTSGSSTLQTGNDASSDTANGVALDGRGNSYVVGNFWGTAIFGLTQCISSGKGDVFLEKYDKNGQYQWDGYGHGADNDDAKSVATYPDGTGGVNIYITGFFTNSITFGSTANTATVNITSAIANGKDMYIAKYDDTGKILWAKDVGNASSALNYTIGWDIAVNNNTNNSGAVSIWVAGSFMGTTSFGSGNLVSGGNQNAFLACYVDAGTAPAGSYFVVGVISGNTTQAVGVDVDADGNAYLTGYWSHGGNANFGGTVGNIAPIGNDDGFVSYYDGGGTIGNAIHFGLNGGGGPNTGTSGEGIAIDEANSTVYVCGSFSGTTNFPNNNSLTSLSGIDGFLMSMSSNLQTVNWLDRIGSSTGDDDAERVVIDNCGQRCYIVGDFVGTESFAGNTVTTASAGGSDSYIADFQASNGNPLRASQSGGTGDDAPTDLAINSVEDIQYCGWFKSTTYSANPAFPNNLTNAGGGLSDGFDARWDDSNWPALEVTHLAINEGVSTVLCNDYVVGDMSGSSIDFGGSTSPLASSVDGNGTYNNDIYLLEYDKYAVANNFVPLTSGLTAETSKDIVSNASYHWVVGNALPTANHQTVTFVNDPNSTDNYTSTINTSNAIFIKTDLSGVVKWGASVRPQNSSSAATGEGVAIDGSNNSYFCGWFSGQVNIYQGQNATAYGTYNSTGANDIFVIKYNSTGSIQWVKIYGQTSRNYKALGISIDPAGSYYYLTGGVGGGTPITGLVNNNHTLVGTTDGFVLRGNASTASNGAAISDAYFGTASVGDKGVDIYSNGITEVYVTGIGNSTSNVYIASYDLTNASGSNNWAMNSTNSSGAATSNDILLGTNGYVYVAGHVGTAGTVTFGSITLSPTSTKGVFVVGLTSWGGTTTWASTLYDALYCTGLAYDDGALAQDHGFITLICGETNTPGAGGQAYLHKATEEGLEFSGRFGHPEDDNSSVPVLPNSTLLFPNPFDYNTVLQFGPSIDPTIFPLAVIVYDVAGKEVKRIDEISSTETTISAEDLSSGIYFYEVIQNGVLISNGKMIVNK